VLNTRFTLQFGDNHLKTEATRSARNVRIFPNSLARNGDGVETNWSDGGLIRVLYAGDIWYAVTTVDTLRQLIIFNPLNSQINLNYAST